MNCCMMSGARSRVHVSQSRVSLMACTLSWVIVFHVAETDADIGGHFLGKQWVLG
jgi:hypothetical protein